MKNIVGVTRSVIVGCLVCLMAVTASAQLEANDSGATRVESVSLPSDKGPIILHDGDKVVLSDGKELTIHVGQVLPVGTSFTVTSGPAKGAKVVVPPPKPYVALALYPLTAFSVAGPITLNNQKGTLGGTKTVVGPTISAALGTSFNHGNQLLEVGGFYFSDWASDADLYQIQIRGMLTKELGLQVAYLNSSKSSEPQASYYGIYDLNSNSFAPGLKHPWDILFGIGGLSDFGSSANGSSTGFINRSSLNFSAFMNASVTIAPNFSVLLSYWYIRDRDTDNSRVALGFGYKF